MTQDNISEQSKSFWTLLEADLVSRIWHVADGVIDTSSKRSVPGLMYTCNLTTKNT